MAETAEKRSLGQKISDFFNGVKAEYSKIIFPNQETIKKQTFSVIVVSIFVGALIFLLDFIMKFLLGFVL